MRRYTVPLLLAALASCKAFGGSGDENVTVNTVVRAYNKPADETWRAVEGVMKEMDLAVDKNNHDALGGNLVAERPNKAEIHVEARSQDTENTQVSVWVDPGDRAMAQIIQERIGDKLGLNAPRAARAAGAQVEGTYDRKLDVCLAAAEEAIREMKLSPPRREMHDTWARLDTQHLDSIPVQFRMERTRKDQTLVVFIAGTASTDDNRTLAMKLKTEFERRLSSAGEGRP